MIKDYYEAVTAVLAKNTILRSLQVAMCGRSDKLYESMKLMMVALEENTTLVALKLWMGVPGKLMVRDCGNYMEQCQALIDKKHKRMYTHVQLQFDSLHHYTSTTLDPPPESKD